MFKQKSFAKTPSFARQARIASKIFGMDFDPTLLRIAGPEPHTKRDKAIQYIADYNGQCEMVCEDLKQSYDVVKSAFRQIGCKKILVISDKDERRQMDDGDDDVCFSNELIFGYDNDQYTMHTQFDAIFFVSLEHGNNSYLRFVLETAPHVVHYRPYVSKTSLDAAIGTDADEILSGRNIETKDLALMFGICTYLWEDKWNIS